MLIVAGVLVVSGAFWQAQGVGDLIPSNQNPILQVFPPSSAEQSRPGTKKFIIFTREQVGTNWDFIAGAWECIPSHPEIPITKRAEFCHSSWDANQLLDVLVADTSCGMYPRFARLQVDSGTADYTINLYDINYRTWEIRCIWQGHRLGAFGVMGNSIFCHNMADWLLLDARSGAISEAVPFIPLGIDCNHNYWPVWKPGETNGCWSYDPVQGQFIAHFKPVDEPEGGIIRWRMSPDGRSMAWVLGPIPDSWKGGALAGRLVLQRDGAREDVSVPIEMQAFNGASAVIPLDIELQFSSDSRLSFRARKATDAEEDRVWTIEVATGKVTSGVVRHLTAANNSSTVLSGVPVPDYLREQVGAFKHFGRGGLAPAFLLYMGILKHRPGFDDCRAGVSRDGRHVLFRTKDGPLSGFYFYGDLVKKQIVRWKSPEALRPGDAQEFVWAETPN
jgi:hypothetical protein